MSEQDKRIIELSTALGLALGALEVINISPHDFSKEGVQFVINRIKEVLKCVINQNPNPN